MKWHAKTWRFLFNAYQNSAYSIKLKSDFDELGQRLGSIFLPEVVMMLRDHDMCPQLVKKLEVAQIIKFINIESANAGAKDIVPGDFTAMNLGQFWKFVQ